MTSPELILRRYGLEPGVPGRWTGAETPEPCQCIVLRTTGFHGLEFVQASLRDEPIPEGRLDSLVAQLNSGTGVHTLVQERPYPEFGLDIAWWWTRQGLWKEALAAVTLTDDLGRCPALEICIADGLAEAGQEVEALDTYRSAAESARTPTAAVEMAYLLLNRARVDYENRKRYFKEAGFDGDFLTWSVDFSDYSEAAKKHGLEWMWNPNLNLTEKRTEVSVLQLVEAGLADEVAVKGPEFPKRRKLMRLAVRTYLKVLWFRLQQHPDGRPTLNYQSKDFGERWELLFALEELTRAMKELDDWGGVEQVCALAFASSGDFEEFDEWPDAFADYFRETLKDAKGKPTDERLLCEEACAERWPQVWHFIPKKARGYIVSAELNWRTSVSGTDWASVVNEYCKAAETTLNRRIGKPFDEERSTAAYAYRSAVEQVTHKGMDIKVLALNTYVRAFQKLFGAPLGKDLFAAWVRERGSTSDSYWELRFMEQLRELDAYRRRADHSGTDSLSERDAEHVRSLLVQSSQSPRGLLVELVSLET